MGRRWNGAMTHRVRALKETSRAYLYLVPAVVIIGAFIIFPMAHAFYLSLHDWPLIETARRPRQFIGVENYTRLLASPRFVGSLRNVALYALFSVPLSIALAVGLAVLLNTKLRGQTVFRLAFFLPFATPAVADALIWRWLLDERVGLINYLLGWIGVSPIGWLTTPALAIPVLVVLNVWQTVGFQAIILLAGLQGINAAYYEAAKIDGANAWCRLRRITVPLLTPQIFFLSIISALAALEMFTQVFVLWVGSPGPVASALTPVFFIYETAFERHRMGLAAAASYILFSVMMILTLIQFAVAKRRVHYDQ
ncbi:TPA: sugar ABC transporter permease [Candidatus Acetothermia bacterium]|nr:sugar ABC transporter permease [Candidatus Acetothermia bacterium]